MCSLLQIDRLTLRHHYNLTNEDECYYFMNYTSGMGYSHSKANKLIINFKKPVTRSGTQEYHYKEDAMRQVSRLFNVEVQKNFDIAEYTLVPIPPSKSKTNQEYDDRMTKVLKTAFPEQISQIKELIEIDQDRPAFHQSNETRSIENLYLNMRIDQTLLPDTKEKILLFDDVITTGAHFKSCKKLLLDTFPSATVIGIFIARREIDDSEELANMFS